MTLHPVLKMCAFVAISSALAIVGLAESADGAESACESPTHCVLMRMPRHETDTDEPDEPRASRLLALAHSIDEATPDARLRSGLLSIVRFEVRAARYVYENRCADGPRGKDECDGGKAKGVFQLHANRNYPEIPDSLNEQARIALRVFRGGLVSCKSLDGAFWRYGVGNGCDSADWTRERVSYLRTVEAMLWRAAK